MLALAGIAVEPDAAMESPPLASGSTFQLVLEQLWGELLLISQSWRSSPSLLSVLPWAMLLCTVLLDFLLKRRLTLRSVKALGQRCSAHHNICAAGSEDIGPTTQDDDTLNPPGVVASPPTLQALCLSAMNTDLEKLLHCDPPSPDGQQQARATQPWAERAEIAVLTQRTHSLQTQEASLRGENSQLDRGIQQLKLKVQNVPDEQDQHILQLHRKLFPEEDRCLALKKKLAGLYREMNFSCQVRNIYRKIAQDLGKELERDACHSRKAVAVHHDRVAKSWVAAASSQRKFEELRKENDRERQMLASVESHCPPFLSDPLAPAALPTAHRGWQVSGGSLGSSGPQEGRRARWEGTESGVACRRDWAPGSRAPNSHSPAQPLRGVL